MTQARSAGHLENSEREQVMPEWGKGVGSGRLITRIRAPVLSAARGSCPPPLLTLQPNL